MLSHLSSRYVPSEPSSVYFPERLPENFSSRSSFSSLLLFPALSSSYFGITSRRNPVSAFPSATRSSRNTVQILLLRRFERRRRPALPGAHRHVHGSPRSSIINRLSNSSVFTQFLLLLLNAPDTCCSIKIVHAIDCNYHETSTIFP